MKEYVKEIEVFRTGAVIASVYEGNRSCGSKMFHSGVFDSENSVRRRAEKAHKWADDRIRTCQEYEVPK